MTRLMLCCVLLFGGCGLAPSFILPRQTGVERDSDLKAAVEEIKAFREWLKGYDAFPILLVPKESTEGDSTTKGTKDTKEF